MNNLIQSAVPTLKNNPLQGLYDIHLPADPSWWPLAPGWWIVMGIIILSATLIIVFQWHNYRWKKNIQGEVNNVILENKSDIRLQLSGLSSILRRVALRQFPHEQVASLHGQAWLEFLQCNSSKHYFDLNHLKPMVNVAYQANPDNEPLKIDDPMVQIIQRWIKENLK